MSPAYLFVGACFLFDAWMSWQDRHWVFAGFYIAVAFVAFGAAGWSLIRRKKS